MVNLEKVECPAREGVYWYGCYDREIRFKKYLHPDTFAHPAKMSLPLANKIFKHLKKLKLLKDGDTVIDFMAGSGRTGITASLHNCKFIGVELEPHFIEMSEKNRQWVENKIWRKIEWKVVQGDARQLSQILNKGGVGVVSPPYGDTISPKGGECRLEHIGTSQKMARRYGSESEGQIGNLKDIPLIGVTSPPYANPRKTTQEYDDKYDLRRPLGVAWGREGFRGRYSDNKENIGNQQNSSYLEAMLQVYSEAFRSGISPLVVVTKNPTRNGELRRLDLDTASLLERVGYEIIDYHRAILFTEHEQQTLTNSTIKKPKGRLSFFKRLSLAKGSTVAQWEDIMIGTRGNDERRN